MRLIAVSSRRTRSRRGAVALLCVLACATAAQPAHAATPGGLDPSFGIGGVALTSIGDGNAQATAVAPDPDGGVVAGGSAVSDGALGFALARYSSAGTLETAFGSGGTLSANLGHTTSQVNALTVESNGDILVAGSGDTSGGATDDNIDGNPFNEESEWDSMPPIYEDDAGNLYAAWYANPGDDACPGSSQNGSTVVSGCVMYREVGAGGVMGPKVVLSEDYGDGQSDGIGDVDQIAANSSGVGWVLDWRYPGSSSNLGLYAEPLSAAASVPTSPTVTGTVTSVPVTCVGTGSCSLTVSLDSGASAIRASAARGHARRSGALVLRRSFTVKAGRHVRLRLALGVRDARLLSRARLLRARLVVTESLGMTAVKKRIYSAAITLRRRPTERAR